KLVAALQQPEVGLVTCLYHGRPVGGFWSRLATLHIDQGFLPQALVGEAIGIGEGCFGATIALRRATLDAVGGFPRSPAGSPTIMLWAKRCAASACACISRRS